MPSQANSPHPPTPREHPSGEARPETSERTQRPSLPGADSGAGRRISVTKIGLASLIGTVVEWYDFVLYGTVAALVFGPVFFPDVSPASATLAGFATISVGFAARPIGAVVFGHYGDKIGRKRLLYISLLIMGTATTLIGILPGYAAIGVAAPIILVTLRFVQGVALGGEWAGAVLVAGEHAPARKRGLFASLPQLGTPAGFLLSGAVLAILAATLTEGQFASWGWRIAFLLSVVLVAVGLYVRSNVDETPAFRRVLEAGSSLRFPIIRMIRAYPAKIILGAVLNMSLGGTIGVFFVFVLSYGSQHLGLPRSTMLASVMVASACSIITMVGASVLSDKIGRRVLCLTATALLGLWAFPAFWLIDTAEPALVILAVTIAVTGAGIGYGPMAGLLAELFDTRVRYSAMSITFMIGGLLGTGVAPLIAEQLRASVNGSWGISLYLAFLSVVGFVAVLLIGETRGVDLDSIRMAEKKGTVAVSDGKQEEDL